jgi:hypothetical protein
MEPDTRVLHTLRQAIDFYASLPRGPDRPAFTVADLLRYNREIEWFADAVGHADILIVGPQLMSGFYSWVVKNTEERRTIFVATNMPMFARFKNPSSMKSLLNHLTIVGHELAHILLDHSWRAVAMAGTNEPLPTNTTDEWEAWLFGEFFRGFVVAEYAWAIRRETDIDPTPELFLHDVGTQFPGV